MISIPRRLCHFLQVNQSTNGMRIGSTLITNCFLGKVKYQQIYHCYTLNTKYSEKNLTVTIKSMYLLNYTNKNYAFYFDINIVEQLYLPLLHVQSHRFNIFRKEMEYRDINVSNYESFLLKLFEG